MTILFKSVASRAKREKKGRRFKVAKVKEIQVRCIRCQQWVASPVSLKDTKNFDLKTVSKSRCQCPRCGDMTSCNIKNIRVLDEEGEFIAIDT